MVSFKDIRKRLEKIKGEVCEVQNLVKTLEEEIAGQSNKEIKKLQEESRQMMESIQILQERRASKDLSRRGSQVPTVTDPEKSPQMDFEKDFS